MGYIYRIMPKLPDGSIKDETYIGFNSHDGEPLYRIREHMESAYGIHFAKDEKNKSSGMGSSLIGKYGASDIVVDVWGPEKNYGISHEAYEAFTQDWHFKNNYKDGELEFAEICWILYYNELGIGWNIGIADQGSMTFEVIKGTDKIKEALGELLNSFGVTFDELDAKKVWKPDNFSAVTFHPGDTVDMKMKLFAPETYAYSRALAYLMTAFTFFRKTDYNGVPSFPEALEECAKVALDGKDCYTIFNNYVKQCRHQCLLMWNRHKFLSTKTTGGEIYTNFNLADSINNICQYITLWATKTAVSQWFKEGKEIYKKVGVRIPDLKKSWNATTTTVEYNTTMKINRNAYVYASVEGVPIPKWYQLAKEYFESHSLGHTGEYDQEVVDLGKKISYDAFCTHINSILKDCPIKDKNEGWAWLIDDPLSTVFKSYFRRSDGGVGRKGTLRHRMRIKFLSVGKIKSKASFIRKWDIYYRQCMSLWLGKRKHLQPGLQQEKFSLGATDRYSLSYVTAVNSYGHQYWFKESTWKIIQYSYNNDTDIKAFLYW